MYKLWLNGRIGAAVYRERFLISHYLCLPFSLFIAYYVEVHYNFGL